MQTSIRLRSSHGDVTSLQFLTFPGGEEHVSGVRVRRGDTVSLDARVRNSSDFLRLLAVTEVLRAQQAKIHLFLPYVPGARSDRREPGCSVGAKLYAELLSAQGYASITILEPHSPVVASLLRPEPIIRDISEELRVFLFGGLLGKAGTYLLSPDAGADKRVNAYAEYLAEPALPVVHATKRRDPATGTLSKFDLAPIPEDCSRLLVVDDICDGGGTFLGLAKEIWAQVGRGSLALELFVAHGIFSKGVGPLLDVGYSRIGTTDSFYDAEVSHPAVTVYKL